MANLLCKLRLHKDVVVTEEWETGELVLDIKRAVCVRCGNSVYLGWYESGGGDA